MKKSKRKSIAYSYKPMIKLLISNLYEYKIARFYNINNLFPKRTVRKIIEKMVKNKLPLFCKKVKVIVNKYYIELQRIEQEFILDVDGKTFNFGHIASGCLYLKEYVEHGIDFGSMPRYFIPYIPDNIETRERNGNSQYRGFEISFSNNTNFFDLKHLNRIDVSKLAY